MTNKEKYANEILNIACSRLGFAVSKRTGKPCYCCDIDCKNQCLLYEEDDGAMSCLKNAAKWGNSKYTTQPTISKKEKMFLSCIDGRATYLGRHCSGELYVSRQKPRLVSGAWGCCVTVKVPEEIFGNMFTFIRNNEEPWPIAELLKLEVEA